MKKFVNFLLTLGLLGAFPQAIEARGGRDEEFRGDEKGRERPVQTQRTPSMSRSIPQPHAEVRHVEEHHEIPKPADTEAQMHHQEQMHAMVRAHYPQKANLEAIKSKEADRFQHKQTLGEQVRTNIYKNNHRPPQWYKEQFWHEHPNPWYRHPENTNWWKWATWASISSWLAWNWSNPVYYDYGENGNVYYSGDNVYIDGEPAYSAAQYAQQAQWLLNNIPQVNAADTVWLPLGVFALTSDERSSAVPNMYLQLALSKDGVISGTYINDTTHTVQPVQGLVDRTSQVAVWHVISPDHQTPILETGIENLTEGETPVLVHFPDGTTQTWLLVRMQQPENIG